MAGNPNPNASSAPAGAASRKQDANPILALGDFFLGTLFPHAGNALSVVRHVLELAWLVAAVVLMLRASGGERFRVKVASQYGDRAARGGR
jgi:uncharacterized membrane protein